MCFSRYWLLAAVAMISAAVPLLADEAAPASPATAEQTEFFEKSVRPLLAAQCQQCHGAQKQEASLRLDSRAALLKGGESGPAIVSGEPTHSLLIKAVRHAGELKMPPDAKKLPDAQIEILSAWIKAGAPWPPATADLAAGPSKESAAKSHWAFQPIRRPDLPVVENLNWCQAPLDRFVLARLEAAHFAPAPPTDRRTLIRRATFDLIGLPPTPKEVEAFVADTSADAFAHVVDRLLASPHYGERWGRYWLDVARYADTKGYVFKEERTYPFAFTYRDWLIHALNDDLPYDQFVLQQLAADKLPRSDDRSLAAMGFLTLGRRFLNNKQDVIDDRIDVVARGLLGLTVGCARCHDHKFDPISAKDYYALYGVFDSSVDKQLQLEPPSAEFTAGQSALQAKIDSYIAEQNATLVGEVRAHLSDYLIAGQSAIKQKPEDFKSPPVAGQPHPRVVQRWRTTLEQQGKQFSPIFAPWQAWAALPAGEFAAKSGPVLQTLRDEHDPKKQLNRRISAQFTGEAPQSLRAAADGYASLLLAVAAQWQAALESASQNHLPPPTSLPDTDDEALRQLVFAENAPAFVPLAEAEHFFTTAQRDKVRDLRNALTIYNGSAKAPLQTLALNDLPKPVTPHVLLRGNPNKPGPEVPRRFLSLLDGPTPQPFKDGSGRLELARKIAAKDNPLTARVLVNRIWLHHFGVGLVRTPSDFGLRSSPPSHPELLDYLATQLINDGWSLKKLHRTIMLSSTYQQSSDNPRAAENARVDPENALLWRMNRQRLDFESLRDSLLAVGGNLDPAIGGRSIELGKTPEISRRTVYAYVDRQNLPGLMRTFDFASPDAHSPQRFSTTIPQQALYLLNGPLTTEQARRLAKRSEGHSDNDPAAGVQRMYALVYGRAPSDAELALAAKYLSNATSDSSNTLTPWERYAQVLLMSNEFSFVD